MLFEVIQDSIIITSLVLVMMLIIEYFNIQSRGKWSSRFQKNKFVQLIIGSFLGMLPGCLGIYAVVSLYTHNLVSFGAMIAAMIASTGDEAFVMLASFPEKAIILFAILFVLGIVMGFITNILFKNVHVGPQQKSHLHIHEHELDTQKIDFKKVINQLKKMSFPRAVLLLGFGLFLFGMLSGHLAHNETMGHDANESPINVVNLINIALSLFGLFIILTVSDHFLQEHLWEHIIKKHLLKVFLWTLGSLLFIHLILHEFELDKILVSKQILVLIAAVLIGIIPESGPHLVFVSLFLSGNIPFSILLANSIVQDGHGAIPLLAESKKSFIIAKSINVVVAFIFGFLALKAGF